MPRRSRLVIPGRPFHIIQRGHNKHACFFEENDCHCYLFWLERLAREAGCEVHAYVLMTNHVHLIITRHELDSLARLMKALNQHYVAYINRLHNWTGTLWEGRFKSCLLHDTAYFLTCMLYIELNPVRAGMVMHPRDYCWSSYRANAEGAADTRIVPHSLYQALGDTPAARMAAYRQLFDNEIDENAINRLRLATNSNFALGSEDALAELSSQLGRQIHPGQPGRPHKPK